MSASAPPPQLLLVAFLALRFGQFLLETVLGRLNHRYGLDPERQAEASGALGLSSDEMRKATAYAEDRYRFGVVSSWAGTLLGLAFLGLGGLGWAEGWAEAVVPASGSLAELAVGLVLFGLLGLGAALFQLPFSFFRTFRVEAKHGFNRQSVGGGFVDWAKGLALAAVLGGPLLVVLLLVLETAGSGWWLWAWAALFAFSAFTAWIFPTLIVPVFNRLEPIPAGELRDGIRELTGRAGFSTRGVFLMDASRRTTHGNAFFAGFLGSRSIVLFDTLIEALTTSQVVAVLAHELGHFKLHHVRWQLVRSTLVTGLLLWLMSLCLAQPSWYLAFGLRGPTAYGALLVFGLWLELLASLLQPLESALSRRQERDADVFAVRHGVPAEELKQALLALRERSHSLPLSHPLYSRFYHSHPPLLERIQSLSAPTPP
jgi:STE24 endopeptidase